ncbi:MAG TPA: polysaccharide deacetylase family protein [Nitrosopumilaceae archaeon]|nr:polysaccharide deacetylase family protein [Nitrosopumilaceae archaeon]
MFSQAFAVSNSCRCVAFRLDDIQDYFLTDAQKKVITTFQKENASLTVGIIGNYFGNDKMIVDVIKAGLQNNKSKLEVANHGWNHEDFTSFNKTEQSQLIKKTDEKILKILGIRPSGFIAPFNKFDNDTISSLLENNLRYISSNVKQDVPSYDFKNGPLYHMPSASLTGDINSDVVKWYGTTHKETFAQIHGSLINYGFAVVTLHPQEYSKRQGLNYTNEVDFNQIRELELLIGIIRNNGLRIVTLNEIPEHATYHQQFPEWIKRIFTWYENKQISAEEVLNAIKFLTENNSIKFKP